VGRECEFLRANPAHFVAFGLVLAWIWLGLWIFGAQAAAVFGVWHLLWPDIYCLKTKFAHQACLFFAKNGLRLVWQKWSKNGVKI
jgi:hypothetical protein